MGESQKRSPLISEEKSQYMREVGISLPDGITRLKTSQLPQLINKKRKVLETETGEVVTDLGKKRRRTSTKSSRGGSISDFFNPVEKLETMFQNQLKQQALKKETEESPIYSTKLLSRTHPTDLKVPHIFGKCHEK